MSKNGIIVLEQFISKEGKMTKKKVSPPAGGRPKILFFDIETAPSKGWFWQMWETNIIEVETPGYMLSFAAKWQGDKRVMVYGLPDFPGYKKGSACDKRLVMMLAELFSEADIVVAHNGDRFDITTTNTRLVVNGLLPMAPAKSVDTLKVARQKFKFLSNKLDDLGNFLGVGRKLPHTGKDLWFKCMGGDMKAWKLMKDYNVQDILLLESVYERLRPWMTNHPNMNLLIRKTHACPNCGSNRTQSRGVGITRTGSYQRYQCRSCGAWSRGVTIKVDASEKVVIR